MLLYSLIQYTVQRGHELFDNEVPFSVTTNGSVLTPEKIDWLMAQNVELVISLDGTQTFHDKHRVYVNGQGSYNQVYDALSYIMEKYPQQQNLVSLQMTLSTYRKIDKIAEEWYNVENSLLPAPSVHFKVIP